MRTKIEMDGKMMIAVLVVAAMASSGCGERDTEVDEEVDLSESEDIFEGEESQSETDISADTVVATVNGEDILFSDVQSEIESAFASSSNLPPRDVLQEQLPALLSRSLENIITRKLVRGAVKEEEVSVPESEVVKRLRRINSEIEGDKRLSEVLAERGMSLDDFKSKLTEDMETQKLIEIHTAEAREPSEEEIENYYEANSNQFVKPDDREDSGKVSLEESKEQIKNYLRQKARQDSLAAYINKLEEDAEIEVYKDLSNVDMEMGEIGEAATAKPRDAPATSSQ